MNKYRENMERIQPPVGLENAVLARVRDGEENSIRVNTKKMTVVLLVAVMCTLLCIGAGASAVYWMQNRAYFPGKGMVDVKTESLDPEGEPNIWVLDEVVSFGEYTVDYAILSGGELRVLMTGDGNELETRPIAPEMLEKGLTPAKRRIAFDTVTATTTDGIATELKLIKQFETETEYSYLDTFVGTDVPHAKQFTLTAENGRQAELTLVPYDEESAVIERDAFDGAITFRVIPLARGSQYIYYDYSINFMEEPWQLAAIWYSGLDLLNEEGNVVKPVRTHAGGNTRAHRFEVIGYFDEPMYDKIVDMRLPEKVTFDMAYGKRPHIVTTHPLPQNLPGEGERIVFDEPFLLFTMDGFTAAATEMWMENGAYYLLMTSDTISAPDGFELKSVSCYIALRTEDGQWFRNKSSHVITDINGYTTMEHKLTPIYKYKLEEVENAMGEDSGIAVCAPRVRLVLE